MPARNFSQQPASHDIEDLKSLVKILNEQTSVIAQLESIIDQLNIHFAQASIHSLNDSINTISREQNERFNQIDALINRNIFNMKKGKTLNDSVLIFGKDVRKIEAGIRTVKLFICDVVNMFDTLFTGVNRTVDRLDYALGRIETLKLQLHAIKFEIQSYYQ